MIFNSKFKINKKEISFNSPTYFIADIAANHDGSLSRAKKLIRLCAKAGANAAKFQHFRADTIVSDYGFKKLFTIGTKFLCIMTSFPILEFLVEFEISPIAYCNLLCNISYQILVESCAIYLTLHHVL